MDAEQAASSQDGKLKIMCFMLQVLQYAGIKKHSSKLSSHQRTKSGRMFGDYTPKFMQAGTVLGALQLTDITDVYFCLQDGHEFHSRPNQTSYPALQPFDHNL